VDVRGRGAARPFIVTAVADDKGAVIAELDLTKARWQRPDGGEPRPGEVALAFVPHTDGQVYVAMRQDDTTLVFTPTEWDAFVKGTKKGEFDQPW